MTEKSVFHKVLSSEMTSIIPSLLLLASRFYTPPEVKLHILVHQNMGKENFLLYLSVHCGDFIKQITL